MHNLIVASYRCQTTSIESFGLDGVSVEFNEQTFVCSIWNDHQLPLLNEILYGKNPRPIKWLFSEN